MDNPATTTDLTNRGYVIPDGSPVAQTRLDEAWDALQLEVPSIVTSIESGWVTSTAVAAVVAAAALRVLRNPEGLVQESSQIDDYSESWRRSDATEDMYFTAAERRRLTPPSANLPSAGSMKYVR
ncbi:hypothetical protein [Nocardioides bruguierae]|uniref:Head-to-tail adaptor n=1 Tax=Nocardioides bruguierae TaxID=2945102 RepID=A0A9X2DBS6_9ACTN|nr:hypothetical protein [Nocardioides bruguierae]MCM0622714.1 hypothetical protein [Nocardioides bruguierae]